jgi:hypothetical protein
MYKILTLLLLGFSFILQANNLLENGSFESSLPTKRADGALNYLRNGNVS